MQRILIIGAPGSGKSTLARAMGGRLGLPVIHMDREYWLPDWAEPAKAAWRDKVAGLAAQEAWIMEGNYSGTWDLRVPRADAIIWLDVPRRLYMPRTLWRMASNYGRQRPDIGPGCPERFDLPFFKDWVWTYTRRSRPRTVALMDALPARTIGVTLRSAADVRRFVAGLPASLAGTP